MGRKYAGILGWLAFALLLLRGQWSAGFDPGVLWQAMGGMLVFAAVGWTAGSLADRFVSESVRARFAAQLQQQTAAADKPAGKPDNKAA